MPLVYTSGTRIPYFIRVMAPPQTDDTLANTQAVDLLLLPNSINVLLERLVKVDGELSQRYLASIATGKSWNRRGAPEGRLIQGEIEIPSGIQTDFTFPSLEVTVSI